MTQIEQIRAEIERLTEVRGYAMSEYDNGRRSAMYDIREQLINFIDSLPAEQPSEELNKEIDRFQKAKYGGDVISVTSIACHFAIWQKEQMMKSAIEVKINRDTLYNLKPIIHEKYQDLKIGDKILIVKENEQ